MNDNKNTDNSFREKLENFSVQPPPHIWDNVQGQLAVQRRKKRMVYIGWMSAAAMVVLAFLAGWYFNVNTEIATPLSVEQQTLQRKTEGVKNDVQEQKSINAELTTKQHIENETDPAESAPKNSLSAKATLVAASMEPDNNNISSEFYPERVKTEMLKSKNVRFENKQQEVLLAEKFIPDNEYLLTPTERDAMAANVTTISENKNTESGWKMGMHISPGYSSYVSSHSVDYSQNMNYSGGNGNGNVGGGFSVQYKTSKRLSIESGVYYAQNGQRSENSFELLANSNSYDYLMASQEDARFFGNAVQMSNGNMTMNSTAGIIEMKGTPKGAQIMSEMDAFDPGFSNSLVTDGEFSQVFDFIEIPLYLRYNLVDSKIGIELMGGVNAGVVVGNNAYIDNSYGIQNIGKTQDISKVNLSGTVGVGLNYGLGEHLSVAVEPRLNYYFNSINNNPNVDYRPYRIGFYTGLYYEF